MSSWAARALCGALLLSLAAAGPAAAPAAATGTPAAGLPAGEAVVATVPSSDGIRILVPATGSPGWRQLAVVTATGPADGPWAEEHCVTGDGRQLALAFAPARYADRQALRDAGAYAAVVDLATGAVRMLPDRVALKYHTPGCGTGHQVVFVRHDTAVAPGRTELVAVDAATGKVLSRRSASGVLASAVPYDGSIAATDGGRVVDVGPAGALTTVADLPGEVYQLRPAAGGALQFLATSGTDRATAYTLPRSGPVRVSATGPRAGMSLRLGAGGNNLLVGEPARATPDLAVVRTASLPAEVSLGGGVLVGAVAAPPDRPGSARVTSRRPGSTTALTVEVAAPVAEPSSPSPVPAVAGGDAVLPTAGAAVPAGAAVTGGGSSPCAVPRLDPATQVVQPSPQQVVWAASRAVRGQLTFTRPAGWQNHGLPAYLPQGLFPRPGLPGGAHVPLQVLLGVLAQESNLTQASYHALPGVAGDPLVGAYYGAVTYDGGQVQDVDPAGADCGYGLAQITDHMTRDDATWTATKKRAVATDYTVNVAAAVSFLETAWNQLQSPAYGIVANDADPAVVENWDFALWAYNSGIHARTDATSPWGLGWTNNPAQNDYDPGRTPFLRAGYQDAANPQRWPYQEKVMGWVEHPQQDLLSGGLKYKGTGAVLKLPGYFTFCTAANSCDPADVPAGYCASPDRTTCWWHTRARWIPAGARGTPENAAGVVDGPEPTTADPYPAACNPAASPVRGVPGVSRLPADAVVVDELASSVGNQAGCPTRSSAGSFSLVLGRTAAGAPTGAVDTHQLGVGYQGHIFFAHTVDAARPQVVDTGTWRPPAAATGWQRIWVHLPANGTDTAQARYRIRTGTTTATRLVDQRTDANVWVDLGTYRLGSSATVSLSNATADDWRGGAVLDIAWDAVAFSPSAAPG